MKRQIFGNGNNTFATDEDDRGVTIMRNDELNSKPSSVFIPWEALTDVALDLVRRAGDNAHA